MARFDHKTIENKWKKIWNDLQIYKTPEINEGDSEKMFILDMFPYPSGYAMHVGHAEGYVGTDILSRFFRMNGKDVLHPMGWDAFGLPAENFAIKTGTQPRANTDNAIRTFKEQLDDIGLSYDWTREVGSHKSEYYKWTQWFFLQLYKKGLAYKKEAPVNWCPKDQTVLANEQVVNGLCERCDTPVVQKNMSQWFFKITDYADKLIDGLSKVDWPESTKINQINWIGKSEGAEIDFKIKNSNEKLRIFTTRLDTIFGATFMVVSPEHPILNKIVTSDKKDEIERYQDESKHMTELERTSQKEKTGVFTGSYAINPLNGKEIPIWVGNFVISTYGTGALMAVPAHDERDYEFAKKYNLPIVDVVTKEFGVHHENEMKRDVAKAVFYNPKTNKYGFMLWEKFQNAPALVGGGVDEGENTKDALIREIKEETGYDSFDIVESLGEVYGNYYSQVRQRWVNTHVFGYFVILNDDTNTGDKKMEYEKDSEFKWVSAKELMDYINNCKMNTTDVEAVNELFKRGLKFAIENNYDKENLELLSEFERDFMNDYGILINSGEYDGLTSEEAYERFVKIAKDGKFGDKKINYKLRDWLVSRQRYWGAPIPIVYDPDGNPHPVDEKNLPVILPDDVEFLPTGESPLKYHKEFHKRVEEKYGKGWKPEVDTMDTFVDSSWYFFRFADPNNEVEFASRDALKKWLPVDIYVGGTEHTVLHLMYARFFTKFLFDEGYIDFDEPFMKLRHPGMILGEDNRKMSKRWGNVIDPRTVDDEFGMDTMRMYEMFMGPFDQMKPWSTTTIQGVRRFLDRVWNLREKLTEESDSKVETELNKLIKKITEDIIDLKFNTAVAEFMKFINLVEESKIINHKQWKKFLLILSPFAPFITEEMWSEIGEKESIHKQSWPKYDEDLIQDEFINVAVQINGKVRGLIEVTKEDNQESVKQKALANPNVFKWLDGKEIKKFIYINGKIVSIVI